MNSNDSSQPRQRDPQPPGRKDPPPEGGLGDLRVLASLVADFVAAEAAVAAAEAGRVRALAAVGRYALPAATSARASEMALREVASEIAAACRVSDRTVQREINDALTLVDSFPATVAAWEAGDISRRYVRVIADAGMELPPDQRRRFDRVAVDIANEVSSPGRLKARLALAAQRLHPRSVTERHRAARDQRAVRVVPGSDGMSDLVATLPTVLAEAIHDRLTQQARVIIDARGGDGDSLPAAASLGDPIPGAVQTSADTRTIDHIRVDVFADLLLAGDPALDPTRNGDGPGTLGKVRARIQVVVPALTMLAPRRENFAPAELVGRGPIDAETARAVAEATALPWDRVITHPVSGAVLHTDMYVRSAAIVRHLRARDRRCRWPGCTAPAIRCEIDHTIDWAKGGKTEVGNLSCLCQRHHTQKQFTRWTVRQLDGGVIEWTSPTGRVYVDDPDPYPRAESGGRVRFDEDPPPWGDASATVRLTTTPSAVAPPEAARSRTRHGATARTGAR